MINLVKRLLFNKTDDSKITLLRYVFYGGLVSVINIILLYVFVEFLKIDYTISNIISMIICITITYILSKLFIFSRKVSIGRKKEFLSYVIISIISIGIDTLVLYICTSLLSIYYLLSKIIAIIVSTGVNFILKRMIYEKYKI